MRFIHTFYSTPLFENKFNKFEQSLKCILTDYALSAHYVQKFGYDIILYTDKIGKELLSFIPYNDVIIIENIEHSKHFAALFKFKALEYYQQGDVLIDGDLFLKKQDAYDRLSDDNCDIIYSFFEPFKSTLKEMKEYYSKLINKLRLFNYEEPYKLPTKWEEMSWMNTSLMKFNNLDLLQEYIREYNHHKEMLKDVDFEYTWPDIIIEQYFLTLLCKDKKKKAMLPNFYWDSKYNQKALKIGFTHLGKGKVCFQDKVHEMLKLENPQLHKACDEQLQKCLETYIFE